MKRRLLVIALVAVVVAVPLLAACTCGGATLTDSDIKTIRGFSARIDSLESQVASLTGKVNNINPGTSQADIDQMKIDLTAIKDDLAKLKASSGETAIAALETRIEALEDKLGTNNEGSTGEPITTRWQPTIELEIPASAITLDYSWYPTRIKDAGTYRITIDITNTGPLQHNQVLIVVLTPANKDTSIDINNTGLYPVSPLSIGWEDVEYSPSDGVDCRRIEFISDDFDIPGATTTPGTMTIKVDFDLYYAD